MTLCCVDVFFKNENKIKLGQTTKKKLNCPKLYMED